MSSNKITEEQLQNFCSITGGTFDRARFFLEASNGDLENAIGSYFEGGANDEDPEAFNRNMISEDNDDDNDDDLIIRNFAGGNQISTSSDPNSNSAFSTGVSQPPQSKLDKPPAVKPRIATLHDQNNDEEDDDDERGQAFYAGGSEHSGQQILGPKSGDKKKADDYIKSLFQKAKDHGAEEVSSNEGGASSSRGPVVYGTGYRLGTGDEPSEVIQGPSKPKPPKTHVLKLWKNGFTIDDDQPLRSYDNPQNKEFLESIEKGVPPRELLRKAEGAEVHLDMQDHREEEYHPPKNKYVLYNEGYKLGSPTPIVVSNASPNDKENNEKTAKQNLKLDESQPSTQIQIRLSDGSRLIIKANQTHRVHDLRAYINTARPEYNGRLYSFNTSFPSKELKDESQSLKDAGILNAVIIQKLTQ